MKTNDTPTLTAEQMTALVAFADKHGADWKEKLMDGWRLAAYPGVLQQIRNQFGPMWLMQFELPTQIQVPAPESSPRVGYLANSKEQVDYLKAQVSLLKAKNEELGRLEADYKEWMSKVECLRKAPSMQQVKFLGVHLADALRANIEGLEAAVVEKDNVIAECNSKIEGLHNEIQEMTEQHKRELLSTVVKCEQKGAFKTCMECGYQDGHDQICSFSNPDRPKGGDALLVTAVDIELLMELRDAANEAANLATRQYRIDHFKFLVAEADELLAHPAPADTRLEDDAARYRWLREKHNDHTSDFAVCEGHLIITHFGDLDLDAAIDAALAAHKGEPT